MRAGPRRIRDDEEGGAGTGGGEGGCGKAEAEAADKSKRPPAPSSVVCVRDRGRREGRRTSPQAEGRSRTACRGGRCRCSLRPMIIMRCVPCRSLCFQHVPLLFPHPTTARKAQGQSRKRFFLRARTHFFFFQRESSGHGAGRQRRRALIGVRSSFFFRFCVRPRPPRAT